MVTRSKLTIEIPFAKITKTVLGKQYELSLVFVNEKTIQELNKKYRGFDEVTDILSFELSKTSGEIFICKKKAREKSRDFRETYLTPRDYLGFLFIHGLLHLKGMSHGSTMEKAEKKFCQLFHFGN